MRPFVVGLSLAMAVHVSLNSATDQARFAARTSAVVIDVSVTDDDRTVSGLTLDDFLVTDNGVAQTVLDLSHDRLPIDVSITADISGSMRPADRQIINQAIEQVGRALRPDDRVMATLFWSHVSERVPLGPPPITIAASDTGHNTSIFDALLLALVRPDLPERRQFSIFMTDGMDTSSYFDAPLVVDTARHTTSPITIVLAPDRAPTSMDSLMKALAIQTGGEFIALKDRQRLPETFGRALENFRASYVLRYIPTGVPSPGWHAVTVSVKNRRYQVRARQGYMGPSQ
jgi:hypothetical protein